MPPREYGFSERLTMSSGRSTSTDVAQILMAEIPGAVNVSRAAEENDRQGIDWWVEMSTAKHLAVDCKVRAEDWAATHPSEDDLALETFSVVERDIPGWTRDASKRCDYVLWLWMDTRRFCLVPFPMLCRVFDLKWQEWREKYKTRRQFTPERSYHSECVFVPRRVLWAEIYRQFGGGLSIKDAA